MGRHYARCSSARFKGKRCRSTSARTTIRCIGSTNGRPTFECWRSWKSRLFECIRAEMRKGSPEGYNAETGYSQPARKAHTGEPNEHQPLYRIRCTQEEYQLLREGRRWNHRGRKHAASDAPGATGVGREAAGAVARRDGSHAVQRMDLRHVETLRCRVANGASGDDEGDRRIQEEERQAGRAENRGPSALQSVASMLRGAAGNPRAAADAALPQPSGGAGDAYEEQDERAAHGGGGRVQQTASAREGILPRIAGHHRRGAGIGERSVAPESRSAGDVSDDAAAIAGPAAETAATGPTRDAAEEHWRSGRSDGSHLGAGSGRPVATPLGGGCGELLRADFGVELIGRQTKAGADLETAQRALANSAGGGGEASATVESAIGSDPRAGGPARTPPSATLVVARKLVAYLLAVDKSGKPFQIGTTPATEEQH